jgi:hypothetical protein
VRGCWFDSRLDEDLLIESVMGERMQGRWKGEGSRQEMEAD